MLVSLRSIGSSGSRLGASTGGANSSICVRWEPGMVSMFMDVWRDIDRGCDPGTGDAIRGKTPIIKWRGTRGEQHFDSEGVQLAVRARRSGPNWYAVACIEKPVQTSISESQPARSRWPMQRFRNILVGLDLASTDHLA